MLFPVVHAATQLQCFKVCTNKDHSIVSCGLSESNRETLCCSNKT